MTWAISPQVLILPDLPVRCIPPAVAALTHYPTPLAGVQPVAAPDSNLRRTPGAGALDALDCCGVFIQRVCRGRHSPRLPGDDNTAFHYAAWCSPTRCLLAVPRTYQLPAFGVNLATTLYPGVRRLVSYLYTTWTDSSRTRRNAWQTTRLAGMVGGWRNANILRLRVLLPITP